MLEYFHVGAAGLNIGDVLTPGSWGQHTRAFGVRRALETDRQAMNLIWEASLESVRCQSFAQEVSRLDCVFACLDEASARRFLQRFRQNPPHNVYRVRPVNPDTPISMGDFNAITNPTPGSLVDIAVGISAGYWNVENPVDPEVLIGGPVQVVAVL